MALAAVILGLFCFRTIFWLAIEIDLWLSRKK